MPSAASSMVLPRHLDPRKFAQKGLSVEGVVDIKALSRLTPLLADEDASSINARFQFGIDEQGVRNVTGVISAKVSLVCQRCLAPAEQVLELKVALGVVWNDEQAVALPKAWDPWILDEGQADIYEMIEDELILGLPIVAYHDAECIPQALYSSTVEASVYEDVSPDVISSAKPNPFQVLEGLKGSLKDSSDKKD